MSAIFFFLEPTMPFYYNFSLPMLAFVCIGMSVGLVLLSLVVSRRFGWTLTERDSGTAAILHGFIGVVYAVALGLIVVGVQGSFGDVAQASQKEASAAGDFYRTSQGMADSTGADWGTRARSYVDMVVKDEWPAVQKGGESPATWALLDDLYHRVVVYKPTTPKESLIYGQVLADAQSILDARRERLFKGTDGMDQTTWFVVLLGAIITVGFTCLFSMENRRVQAVLTSLTGAMFGLMIFLIVAMDYPLRGSFSVSPDAFVRQQENFARLASEASTTSGGASRTLP